MTDLSPAVPQIDLDAQAETVVNVIGGIVICLILMSDANPNAKLLAFAGLVLVGLLAFKLEMLSARAGLQFALLMNRATQEVRAEPEPDKGSPRPLSNLRKNLSSLKETVDALNVNGLPFSALSWQSLLIVANRLPALGFGGALALGIGSLGVYGFSELSTTERLVAQTFFWVGLVGFVGSTGLAFALLAFAWWDDPLTRLRLGLSIGEVGGRIRPEFHSDQFKKEIPRVALVEAAVAVSRVKWQRGLRRAAIPVVAAGAVGLGLLFVGGAIANSPMRSPGHAALGGWYLAAIGYPVLHLVIASLAALLTDPPPNDPGESFIFGYSEFGKHVNSLYVEDIAGSQEVKDALRTWAGVDYLLARPLRALLVPHIWTSESEQDDARHT